MIRSNLVVAIASESNQFDREVYRRLLELVLEIGVSAFKTDIEFGNRTRVRTLANAFLERVLGQGVRHALFAIDNDGGMARRPAHDPAHNRIEQMTNPNDACSTCLMDSSVAPKWYELGVQVVFVVPIQTIETWLLVAQGSPFEGRPENTYHRPTLKKRLYGKPEPPVARRLEVALSVLSDPNALERMRALQSFVLFEQQVRSWLSAGETAAPSM